VAKAATLRSAPAIEVAMLRSGRVLQRSKNRFDSPMATARAATSLRVPIGLAYTNSPNNFIAGCTTSSPTLGDVMTSREKRVCFSFGH
jgi:hypothetical protein